MNPNKTLLAAATCCAVLALAVAKLAAPVLRRTASGRQGSETLYATIDTYVQGQMARLNLPGAAPAVMQLVEAGKLALDAPVQRCLSWFTRPRNPVNGNILAGEVEASGKDIARFRAGDQVYAFTILSQTVDRLMHVEPNPCYLRHLHRLNRPRARWQAWLASTILSFSKPADPFDLVITILAEDQFSYREQLTRVAAPTLVIAGERDPFYSPALFQETAAGIPDARLILYPGMGHPASGKRFKQDVLAFLREGRDDG